MTLDLDDAVHRYVDAWSAEDSARQAILAEVWADNGVYCDPIGRAEGRDALSDHIGASQTLFPGHRIEASSEVDEHDGHFRFAWIMLDSNDAVVLEGVDYGVLDNAGRIALIVGFFGPLAPRDRAS